MAYAEGTEIIPPTTDVYERMSVFVVGHMLRGGGWERKGGSKRKTTQRATSSTHPNRLLSKALTQGINCIILAPLMGQSGVSSRRWDQREMTSLPRTFFLYHASSNFSHLLFLLCKSQGNVQLRYGCIYYPLHMCLAPSVSMPLGHPIVNSAIHTNAAVAGRNDLTVNFQSKSWKGHKTWGALRPWSQLDFFYTEAAIPY